MTEARAYGLGGVLLQVDQEFRWAPVLSMIHNLKKAECSYAPAERDFLDIVYSFLKSRQLSVVTDHLSLKWSMSLKDLRDKLARWVVEMQDYEFVTEHRNGTELSVPDTLSLDAVPKQLEKRCLQEMENVSLLK